MKPCLLSTLLIFFSSFIYCQTTSSPLHGKWAFERFEYFGDLLGMPEDEKAQHDNMCKGMILTFTPEGQYRCEQPDGLEQNNFKTKYRFINNGKQFIAFKDTLTIRVVNDKQLKLYHSDNRPLVVFKRIK